MLAEEGGGHPTRGKGIDRVGGGGVMWCDALVSDQALPPLIYPDRPIRFLLC